MQSLSIASIALALCFACILAYAAPICWRILYSPLNAGSDAHWSVKYSGAWIWWQRVRERDTLAVHEAHQRLGAVVRLGPIEISVCDLDSGVRLIYEGRLPKSDWYRVAISYGEEPMFAMRDERPHTWRKKMVAKPYLKTSLMADSAWHVQQSKLAEDLRSSVEEFCGLGPDTELYDLFFAWSVASVSTYIFGHSGSLNLLHNLTEAHRLRQRYASQRTYQLWVSFLPVPQTWLRRIGLSAEISWIWEMQDRAERHQANGTKETAPEAWPTVYAYMKEALLRDTGRQDGKAKQLSTGERSAISSEMQDHVVAGINTSTASLATCAWLLSLEHNRKWQNKLREEVRPFCSHVQPQDVDQLPILDAIVKETLRLYPPVAGCQPRVTNKTLVLGPEGHQLTVPRNVTVHAQAWTLHRNSVFEHSEEWRPERWLYRGRERSKEMNAWFWAFGSGSRKCLGENLALSSLKVAIVAIWSRVETRTTDDTKFTLSHGNLAVPTPNNGQFIRLRVNKVEPDHRS